MDDSAGPATINVGDIRDSQATAIGSGAQAFVTNIYSGAGDSEQERDRRTLLTGVRTDWVDGVLAKATHGAPWIELDRAVSVCSLARLKYTGVDPENRPDPPPPDASVGKIFRDLARMLLIVGDQGSGKTITLLALARELLDEAARNLTEPMPVVINLSTWTPSFQRFEAWLAAELRQKYTVSARTAQRWIDKHDLTLLLDGLDEVHIDHRASCVHAINAFRNEHAVGIVVCSRAVDYAALDPGLVLGGTVHLQPLGPEQIQTYIRGASGAVPAGVLEQALREDAALRELAQTPLMLRLLTSLPQPALPTDTTPPSARGAQVLEAYVQRCLRRDDGDAGLAVDRASVEWLARGMAQHGQSMFLIEALQPDWLPSRRSAGLHGLVSDVSTVLLVVATAVLSWFVTGSLREPASLMAQVGAVGLLAALTIAIVAVLGFARGATARLTIRPVEALGWSRRSALVGMRWGALLGFALGLISSLPVTLESASGGDRFFISILDLAVSCTFAIVFGVFGVLIGAWSGRNIAERVVPNQGIRQSARNAAIAATVSLVLLFLIWLLISSLQYVLAGSGLDSWPTAVVTWLALPVIAALRAGGMACIQHVVLRAMLARGPAVPWDLRRLLDLATEKRLMQKAGGGYLFVHRRLRDHLAHT